MFNEIPRQVPRPGFYYHYKHDVGGPVEHYAYEVIGIGFHTEEAREGEEHFVMYRPLYPSALVYQASRELGVPCFNLRPLKMWMGTAVKNGVTVLRFTPIADQRIIRELKRMRASMYR